MQRRETSVWFLESDMLNLLPARMSAGHACGDLPLGLISGAWHDFCEDYNFKARPAWAYAELQPACCDAKRVARAL